jgi:hypothetical protein
MPNVADRLMALKPLSVKPTAEEIFDRRTELDSILKQWHRVRSRISSEFMALQAACQHTDVKTRNGFARPMHSQKSGLVSNYCNDCSKVVDDYDITL